MRCLQKNRNNIAYKPIDGLTRWQRRGAMTVVVFIVIFQTSNDSLVLGLLHRLVLFHDAVHVSEEGVVCVFGKSCVVLLNNLEAFLLLFCEGRHSWRQWVDTRLLACQSSREISCQFLRVPLYDIPTKKRGTTP